MKAEDFVQKINEYESHIVQYQDTLDNMKVTDYKFDEVESKMETEKDEKFKLLNKVRFLNECSTAEKYIIKRNLKLIKKYISVTGKNVSDCFMMD